MHMTHHAEIRCHQRSIPPAVLGWLVQYGAESQSHGATKRYFDKAARRALARDLGTEVVSRLGDLLDCYLVESDTRVITAGVRTKRIRRR